MKRSWPLGNIIIIIDTYDSFAISHAFILVSFSINATEWSWVQKFAFVTAVVRSAYLKNEKVVNTSRNDFIFISEKWYPTPGRSFNVRPILTGTFMIAINSLQNRKKQIRLLLFLMEVICFKGHVSNQNCKNYDIRLCCIWPCICCNKSDHLSHKLDQISAIYNADNHLWLFHDKGTFDNILYPVNDISIISVATS